MSHIRITQALLRTGYHEHSESGARAKRALHTQGKAFLGALAYRLGLQRGEYQLRTNRGGTAVSGEVTLHTEHLYVQLSEAYFQPGLSLMYRTCDGMSDYCGHRNHFIRLSQLEDKAAQTRFIQELENLIARKLAAQQPVAA